MKNQDLFSLNFSDLLRYDMRELRHRKAQSKYDPPLACSGFCTACEQVSSARLASRRPPLMSHGCDTLDYESKLGSLADHLQQLGIRTTSAPVMFLLESPGAFWESGIPCSPEGVCKQPPTMHYYWTPHKIDTWQRAWVRPEQGHSGESGEYYGDYFAYLMAKHGFLDVYITNLIKCKYSLGREQLREVTVRCMERYLRREIEIFQPAFVFSFGRSVDRQFSRRFPGLKARYLRHPSAIQYARRYKATPERLVEENDGWVSTAIGQFRQIPPWS